jgi:hypothetical protein
MAFAGTFIEAVDLVGRRVLLSSGAVLAITGMVDKDWCETADPDEAVAFTCIGGDLNLKAAVVCKPWPVVH